MHTGSNNSCIVIAIFYSQKQWHVLVRKLIKPLLKELLEKKLVERYYLFAEKKKGEHITIAVVPSLNKDISSNYLTSCINEFLHDYPSDTVTTIFPLKTFFMDFPNNSVYVNHLEEIDLQQELTLHPLKSEIRHHVSKAITEVFAEEEISMETLYSFIVYMQLGLAKAVYPDAEQAINAMDKLRNGFPRSFKDENEEDDDPEEFEQSFKRLFEQNKELLNEITLEIWSKEAEVSLPWLLEWERNCRQINPEISFEEHYFLFSSILYKHLGFPSNTMLTNSTLNLVCESLHDSFLKQD
jgi:hypothetical protein